MQISEVFSLSALGAASSPYRLVQPKDRRVDLTAWAQGNREALQALLLQHKAILFRDFRFDDEDKVAEFVNAVTLPVEYLYRSTPRTSVGKNIYTATEYPKAYAIPVHCENAYQRTWPMKLFFYCKQPAQRGGETPLADISAVTRQLRVDVKETFVRKQISYVRNLGSSIDLSWQTVFQTESKAEVEKYCRENDIGFLWKKDGTLRTSQTCPAMATHPSSGELLWFNQAHLFHISSLDESTREAMLDIFAVEDLPRNSYYGDGSTISDEHLDHIRATFDSCTMSFKWQRNDLLMVDNMQVAHGRTPFVGDRTVLVMMGE
jgi:alpha-ketoglutarate-dependent taurine dioxygenase